MPIHSSISLSYTDRVTICLGNLEMSEFYRFEGNVRDFGRNFEGRNLFRESCPKTCPKIASLGFLMAFI